MEEEEKKGGGAAAEEAGTAAPLTRRSNCDDGDGWAAAEPGAGSRM